MQLGTIRRIREVVHSRRLPRLALAGVEKALTIFCALCVCFCGCLAVTPAPKRVKGQSGVVEKPFDLSFIQAGQTPRTEVEEKLKHFDVGIQSQSFFMARWSTASWAVIGAPGSSMSESISQRWWRNQNLLIEFDGTAKVKSFQVFSSHELVSRLMAVLASQAPLDLSHPVEVDAELDLSASGLAGRSGKIILTPGTLTFKESGTPKKPYSFQVATADIAGFGSSDFASADDPVHAVLGIHLRKKINPVSGGSGWGAVRRVSFNLTVPGMVTILKFFEQSKQTASTNELPPRTVEKSLWRFSFSAG